MVNCQINKRGEERVEGEGGSPRTSSPQVPSSVSLLKGGMTSSHPDCDVGELTPSGRKVSRSSWPAGQCLP